MSAPARRVLLVGSGSGAQDRLRETYLPALLGRSDTAVSIWDDGDGPAARSAGAEGLGLEPDLADAVARHTAVIASAGPETLAQLARAGRETSVPVMVDRPTTLGTKRLEELARDSDGRLRAAHHSRFHPAVAAVRGAVQSGRLGLVHAIHGELLVGGTETAPPGGELRSLVADAVDVVTSVLGPLSGTGYAVSATEQDGAGEVWTVSLQLDPGIVVTLLVGRSSAQVTDSVHRYRVLGSHGQLLADLAGPEVQVLAGVRRRVSFGPRPLDLLLDAFLTGGSPPDLASALATSRVLDTLESSSTTNTALTFGDQA